MKKPILLLLPFMLISCGGQNGDDFVGKWVEKNTESDLSEIIQNGKNYIASDKHGKYTAEYNDGILEISGPMGSMKATLDQNGNLILAGKEYIPFEKSEKSKLIGIWRRIPDNPEELNNSFKFNFDLGFNGDILKISLDENMNIIINNGKLNNGDFIQDSNSEFLRTSFDDNQIRGQHSMTIQGTNETFRTRFNIEIKGNELYYSETDGHRDARFEKE